jgi:hypothetical protein
MTIFIDVVRALVKKCLDTLVTNSSSKDSGWRPGRDKDLSEAQREIVLGLRGDIDKYVPEKPDQSDKLCLDDLKRLVLAAVNKITEKRKAAGYNDDGTTKAGLLKINTDLDMFLMETEKKLTLKELSFNFLDIPHDTKPINIFAYHALYYYGENLFIPHEEGAVKKGLMGFFGHTTPASIRSNKELILLRNIVGCKKRLDALKEGEEHNDMRKEFVVHAIEAVQRENEQLCKTNKMGTEVPVTLTLGATLNVGTPTFKPSRGRLEEAMEAALKEINPPAPVDEKKIPSGAFH